MADEPIDYGQVGLVVIQIAQPVDTTVIWIKANPEAVGNLTLDKFNINIGGAWVNFKSLFQAIHYGENAPADTSKIWLKIIAAPQQGQSDTIIDYFMYREESWQSFTELFAGIVVGENEPAVNLQKKLWIKVTAQGDYVDTYIHKDGTWSSFTDLFAAIHTGSQAPADTNKLWRQVSGGAFIGMYAYDNNTATWLNIFAIKVVQSSEDYTLQESDHMSIVRCNNADPIVITLENALSLNFLAIVKSLSTGQVLIQASPGVFLNGEAGGVQIIEQWGGAVVEKYSNNNFNIIGTLV